jgi:hypothetical protein
VAKKMIDYLPPFMQQFEEMKQLMQSEDKQVATLNMDTTKILRNAFIETSDAEGIERFERILHIIPGAGENLELRRSRVSMRWNERIPYTHPTLVKCLNASLGENNYDLYSDEEHYYILVHLKLNVADRVGVVEELIRRMSPEDICYKVLLIYNTHAVLHKFTHAQLHNYTHRQLREEVLP